MGAGFEAFQANIIPLGIDQLIDSSSAEIKSFIGGGCGIFDAGTHSICRLSCGPGHHQDVQEKDKD